MDSVSALVYLLAAIIAVPFAKRFGLGSVIGYLVAGVVIGPHVLGLLPERNEQTVHLAEFGVVMMLFVIGLEIKPSRLKDLWRPILGLGGSQVVATALAIMLISMAFGISW